MRNTLWLISAFTVAATSLSLTSLHANAASQKTAKISTTASNPAKTKQDPQIAADRAYNEHLRGCPVLPKVANKEWGWQNARLTAQFIQQPDGSYLIHELPGAKNPDVSLPIASISKIMTALVILELVDQKKFSLDQKIAVTKESLCLRKEDNRFAVRGLPAGLTEIVADHAMGHMIKKSSNTMTVNLAIAAAGSVENFVGLMNAKAKEWKMTNTVFLNPNGLPEGDRKIERTTARDMALMAVHALPYLDRIQKYESDPLQTWTLEDNIHKGKQQLANLGGTYKTATINECASLWTVAKKGPYILFNVELCGQTSTRFSNAITAITNGFKYVSNMVIPSAMASETVKRPDTMPVSLSTRPDRSVNP